MFAVVERPLFSLECAASSLNLVRDSTATLKVTITRQSGFQDALTYSAANLPQGVTMELVDSAPGEATLRFRAAKEAVIGRAARVSLSGSAGGQTQAAPKISILVD